MANVRGQGTAHLVRCTLDPIVGCVFVFSNSLIVSMGRQVTLVVEAHDSTIC